ncbi:hypothetical protein FQZ97_704100 [compost metagenome]
MAVLLQIFITDDVENSLGSRDANGIATESVEVANLRTKVLEQFWLDRNAGDGEAVAHGFTHHHDVRLNAVALVAPEVQTGARKARLHFVGDEYAAMLVHHIDRFLKEATRVRQQAVGGENAVRDESGKLDAVALHVSDCCFDIGGQALTQIDPRLRVIRVGSSHGANVLINRHVLAHGGRDCSYRSCDAVVGIIGDDDAGAAGIEFGDPQGEVYCFGAGAGVHHTADPASKGLNQLLGVAENLLVHVACMGVERRQLLRDGLDHAWVAMAHRRHVVVAVQVLLSIRAVHVHAFRAHELHGVLVHQLVGGTQKALTTLDHGLLVSIQGRKKSQVKPVLHASRGRKLFGHLSLQKPDCYLVEATWG